jgi:hypothetical protein
MEGGRRNGARQTKRVEEITLYGVRTKQQNTEIFTHTAPRPTCVGKFLPKVKESMSVSNNEVFSIQDSSDADTAALLEICVCQKKCLHIVTVETEVSECSI